MRATRRRSMSFRTDQTALRACSNMSRISCAMRLLSTRSFQTEQQASGCTQCRAFMSFRTRQTTSQSYKQPNTMSDRQNVAACGQLIIYIHSPSGRMQSMPIGDSCCRASAAVSRTRYTVGKATRGAPGAGTVMQPGLHEPAGLSCV